MFLVGVSYQFSVACFERIDLRNWLFAIMEVECFSTITLIKKTIHFILIHHKSMYICSMYSKELVKGTLLTIILKLLNDNDRMYGYQITQKVKELSEDKILIKEGSLYPALHKLKSEGLVSVETEHIGKRVRHYYRLTEMGKQTKEEKEAELLDFIETINKVITS